MNSYTGTFEQIFTDGKFKGITMNPETITFPTKTEFNNWVLEINKLWVRGKLNYFVAMVKDD